MHSNPRAFTLVELLVVVGIVCLLASLLLMGWPAMRSATQRSVAISNLRAVGAATQMYVGDNDGHLPARVTSSDKWPVLLSVYLDDLRVFAIITDSNNFIKKHRNPLENGRNNTSYIMNGFNDIGAYTDETVSARINQVEKPSEVILFSIPKTPNTHFYMDMLGGNGGDHINVLDLGMFNGGSVYLFADGSARFIKKDDYDPTMWLVNADFAIP